MLVCFGSGLGSCRRGWGLGVGVLYREILVLVKLLFRGFYSFCVVICFLEGYFEIYEIKYRL